MPNINKRITKELKNPYKLNSITPNPSNHTIYVPAIWL